MVKIRPPVDAPHRLIEHAAAYRVVDDVSAASVCERFNRFSETAEFAALEAVIDDVIRTARLNTRFSSLPAVAITVAPICFPRSTAAMPTPPAAP